RENTEGPSACHWGRLTAEGHKTRCIRSSLLIYAQSVPRQRIDETHRAATGSGKFREATNEGRATGSGGRLTSVSDYVNLASRRVISKERGRDRGTHDRSREYYVS